MSEEGRERVGCIELVWEYILGVLRKGMRQGIMCRGGWRVNSGAVSGYEVALEHGTTEEVTEAVYGERS